MDGHVRVPIVEKSLQEASFLYRQGRLDAARRLRRSILQASPENFDCLHGLGLIELKLDKFTDATALLRRAVRQKPNSAMACNRLGLALQSLAQYSEANDMVRGEGSL